MSLSDAFHEFERRGWTDANVVRAYAGGFGELTVNVIPALLAAAGVAPGISLLDVATGPGYLAAEAAKRGARVIGVDFATGMVEEARRRFPGLDVREGDALALPFEDATFDAVTINFGLLHFADPLRALQEAFRVLKPGGRAAATVWCKPDSAVGFGLMLDAIAAHGDMSVPLPPGPPFFLLSDHATFRDHLSQSGFTGIEVRDFPQTWRLPSFDALVAAFYEGTARTGALLRAQRPDALESICAAARDAAMPYLQADGSLELPMPCALASGSRT